MTTDEIWKPVTVPEFEDLYEVSSLGRVRSLPRKTGSGAVMGGRVLEKKCVTLCRGDLRKSVPVHKLVACAFEGRTYEDGRRGGMKSFGARNGHARLDDRMVLEIRRRYAEGGISQKALAKEYGISQPQICKIVSRKRWPHLS